MDYYAGMKFFDKALEKLCAKMSQDKRYIFYDKICDEAIKERKQTYDKSRNSDKVIELGTAVKAVVPDFIRIKIEEAIIGKSGS